MITLYSSDTCAPCASVKRYLDSKQAEYRVFDADDPIHSDQLIQLTGRRIVPTAVSNGKVVVGLNYKALAEMVEAQHAL